MHACIPAMAIAKPTFQSLRGLETTTKTTKPITNSAIVAADLASASSLLLRSGPAQSLDFKYTIHVVIAATAPAGRENRKTLRRKPGRTKSVFGAKASIRPGRPILNVPIKVNCLGKNGNSIACMPIRAVNNNAYAALVTKRFATRSMLLITFLPCASTSGRVEKLLSNRTS